MTAIEADLLRSTPTRVVSQPPDDLMKRGGAYYSTLATQLLNADYNDLHETHVINTPHRGVVAGWPGRLGAGDARACVVGRIRAVARGDSTAACFGLLAAVKVYELLTVEARGARRPGRSLPGAARPPAGAPGREGANRPGRYAGDEPPASAAVSGIRNQGSGTRGSGTRGQELGIRNQGSGTRGQGTRDQEPGDRTPGP